MLEHVFAECVPVFQFRQFGLQQVKQFAQVWRSIKFRRAQPPEPEESHVVRFQLQVRREDNDRIADVVKNAALNRKQVAEAAGGGQTVGNVFVSDNRAVRMRGADAAESAAVRDIKQVFPLFRQCVKSFILFVFVGLEIRDFGQSPLFANPVKENVVVRRVVDKVFGKVPQFQERGVAKGELVSGVDDAECRIQRA